MKDSKIYQLYEYRDELRKIKAAIPLECESKRRLSAIILSGDKHDEFTAFAKAVSDEAKEAEAKIPNINTQIEALDKIIAMHEKKDETSELVNQIVTDLLIGLNLAYKPNEKVKTEKK